MDDAEQMAGGNVVLNLCLQQVMVAVLTFKQQSLIPVMEIHQALLQK